MENSGEISTNYYQLIHEELQTQTLLLNDIVSYKEIEKENFDNYFFLLSIPFLVMIILKIFLRW